VPTAPAAAITGRERFFEPHEVIVSKTDLQGRITYANEVFLRVSSYAEADVVGQPHNLIRHPEMPRAVFALLWERLAAGEEIFAYVVNLASTGDHYWVLAHVTPTRDAAGRIIGYHSNRRVPTREAVAAASELYRTIRAAETAAVGGAKAEAAAGTALLQQVLDTEGRSYDEFVFGL
jgi:PAS domain S-box-containing protein